MTLSVQIRKKIYDRVCQLVTRKHFDPGMNGANWEELSKTRKDQILRSNCDDEFEKQMRELLNELKTSHTGFRHSKSPNIPAADFPCGRRFPICGSKARWQTGHGNLERTFSKVKEPSRNCPEGCPVLSVAWRDRLAEGDDVPRGSRD